MSQDIIHYQIELVQIWKNKQFSDPIAAQMYEGIKCGQDDLKSISKNKIILPEIVDDNNESKLQLQEATATQDLAKEHTNDIIRKNDRIHRVDDEAMTMSTAAKVKISDNNYHSSKRRRSRTTRTTTPLLPQIISYDATANSVICLPSEKSIPIIEFWTTERLIDEFTQQLLKIDAKPDFGIICNDTNLSSQMMDTSEEFERRHCLSHWKYLSRAQRAIATYCDGKPIVFIINLSDLTDRLKTELIDLSPHKSILGEVLHSVVQQIFAAISSNWFYESAAKEIEVLIQP